MQTALTKIVLSSVSWHLVWLWLWFLLGTFWYIGKRAYYLVTGPNPVASTYKQFFQRCWLPLLLREIFDGVLFWLLFNQSIAADGLQYLGWQKFSGVVSAITQFAPVAFLFGHYIDSLADTIISKVPGFKDWLPQMPGPLPPTPAQAVAKAEAKAEANAVA
jgi:hypothetical protein